MLFICYKKVQFLRVDICCYAIILCRNVWNCSNHEYLVRAVINFFINAVNNVCFIFDYNYYILIKSINNKVYNPLKRLANLFMCLFNSICLNDLGDFFLQIF